MTILSSMKIEAILTALLGRERHVVCGELPGRKASYGPPGPRNRISSKMESDGGAPS